MTSVYGTTTRNGSWLALQELLVVLSDSAQITAEIGADAAAPFVLRAVTADLHIINVKLSECSALTLAAELLRVLNERWGERAERYNANTEPRHDLDAAGAPFPAGDPS